MKIRVSAIIIFMFLCNITVNAQQIANIQTLTIDSKILNQKRPVLVYTPPMYSVRNLMSYNVIYVFDAQNREIFDLVHASLSFTGNSGHYIVVGITSPSYPNLNYYRNSDYLPKPINNPKQYGTDNPNAENFWKYVTDEVFPEIDKKFNTTSVRIAVGHSLSASFILDKAVHFPEAFNTYLAISPNFGYDEYRLANAFINNDFTKTAENKFIYLSQANEAITMPAQWKTGYEKVKQFINNRDIIGKYTICTKEFPEENHWNTYPPSLTYGLKKLKTFLDDNPIKPNGEFVTLKFRITVPNAADDAYISGNQKTLGNWDASKTKLNKVSDFERELEVKVQFPLEFKITRGSWDSQAVTDQNDGGNIVISKTNSKEIKLKVEAWFDR